MINDLALKINLPLQEIGFLKKGKKSGLMVLDKEKRNIDLKNNLGWNHFS